MISNDFEKFCESIVFDDSLVAKSISEIFKKLNNSYYDIDSTTEHGYVVGSLGRKTAVKGCSDIDVIFDLPKSVFKKYDNYESNGQSKLLQEVKNILLERYPRTEIKGDGQVVVIEFDKYTVELVPAFIQKDMSFIFPNSNDGGSWKKTDPFSEQLEVENIDLITNSNYRNFCRLLRVWRNNNGLILGGLLIDTLCYSFFTSTEQYNNADYSNYYSVLIDLFYYLKQQDKTQKYWFAVGSNQHVYSHDNSLISKASSAYTLLSDADSEKEKNDALVSIFGNKFPHTEKINCEYNNTEQFIENMCALDIRYSLKTDCKVEQDGYRVFHLREALTKNIFLRHNKKLEFYIAKTDAPKSCEVYWKVRNVGSIAEKKNMIRGQILKTNKNTHNEYSQFHGEHYVECFLVLNGVCVARDRIRVPIGTC